MRNIGLLFLLLLALLSCRIPTPENRQGPIICLTFDDGDLSVYTQALPILQQYGMPATVFINSGLVGDDGKMTWQQLSELDTLYHWEVGGHTYRHEHLQNLTYSEAEQAIKTDYDTLCTRGFNPVSFAVPRGVCPSAFYGIIQSCYRNVRRSLNIPLYAPVDRSYLGYYPYIMGFTANDMINRIKSGVYNDEDMIVLGFHELYPTSRYDTTNCPPEVFAQVINYLVAKGYRVMTLDSAVEYLQ